MIDTFTCIPFDLPRLIFKKNLLLSNTFSFDEFLPKFKEVDATSNRRSVLYFISNLHKVTSFFDVTAVNINVT